MKKIPKIKLCATTLSAVMLMASVAVPFNTDKICLNYPSISANAINVTLEDLPEEYKYPAEWIWQNRICAEQSTVRQNTIFDQIIAGKGTINYVVRWQSYKTITLEQRKAMETLVSDSINAWNDWLAGYENWPYDHIDVNIVGWAVLDKSLLLDLQEDEVVYDNLISDYDSTYDTSNGIEEIPDKLPSAPSELSRFDHFTDKSYEYPGGLDKRFDMYLWATQGFPAVGGCGGDWGQRLSDDAYLNMLDGSNVHVLEHEIGHGFGITDFYGGEGESDGYPPGGFPDDGTSIMMAGSSAEITDFDGWLLRYMWSMIKDEEGRFDIEEVPEETTPVETTTTTTTSTQPLETTTTVTTVSSENNDSDVSFTEDEYGNWIFDAQGADEVKLTFKAQPWAVVSGVIGYWIDEWKTIDWAVEFGEDDTMSVIVDMPEDVYSATIQKYYSAVWDNATESMTDVEAELVGIELIYNDDVVETTTTTVTESEVVTTTTTVTEPELSESTVTTTVTTVETEVESDVTTTTEVVEDIEKGLLGDANCDGKVAVADSVAVSAYVSNAVKNELSEQGIYNADVHSKGNGLNASDALMIQQYATGVVNSL